MKQQGYILTNRHAFQQIFQKFEDGGLFMIDLISNFNFHTRCLPSLELSSTGNEEVGRSTILYKCFKYLCYNRLDKSDYIGQHREELAAFLKDKRNFVWISTQVIRRQGATARSFPRHEKTVRSATFSDAAGSGTDTPAVEQGGNRLCGRVYRPRRFRKIVLHREIEADRRHQNRVHGRLVFRSPDVLQRDS